MFFRSVYCTPPISVFSRLVYLGVSPLMRPRLRWEPHAPVGLRDTRVIIVYQVSGASQAAPVLADAPLLAHWLPSRFSWISGALG